MHLLNITTACWIANHRIIPTATKQQQHTNEMRQGTKPRHSNDLLGWHRTALLAQLCAPAGGDSTLPMHLLFRHSSTFTVTTVGGRAGCSPEVPSSPYSSTILWQGSLCASARPLQLSWGLEFSPGLLGQVYSTSRTRRSSWVCFFLFFNSVKSCITYKLYPLRQERSSNKFSYSFCPFVRAEY